MTGQHVAAVFNGGGFFVGCFGPFATRGHVEAWAATLSLPSGWAVEAHELEPAMFERVEQLRLSEAMVDGMSHFGGR